MSFLHTGDIWIESLHCLCSLQNAHPQYFMSIFAVVGKRILDHPWWEKSSEQSLMTPKQVCWFVTWGLLRQTARQEQGMWFATARELHLQAVLPQMLLCEAVVTYLPSALPSFPACPYLNATLSRQYLWFWCNCLCNCFLTWSSFNSMVFLNCNLFWKRSAMD